MSCLMYRGVHAALNGTIKGVKGVNKFLESGGEYNMLYFGRECLQSSPIWKWAYDDSPSYSHCLPTVINLHAALFLSPPYL